MKDRLFDLAIGGLAGFVLAAGLSLTCYDKQMRAVQDYAHTVAVNAMAITTRARANADSLRHRADSLLAVRAPVILQATVQTASADQLERSLADQRSTADSNLVLRAENRALRGVVVNLWQALQQSDTIIALERQRGDSLNRALGDVHLQLQTLASKIEGLKPPPKFLRIAWRVVEDAGFAWAGYQWGRHDRAKAESAQPVRVELR